MSGTSPAPPLPANAGTATKLLFTIGALLALIAAITWPTGVSTTIGQYATTGAALAFGAGLIVHAYWDHSP